MPKLTPKKFAIAMFALIFLMWACWWLFGVQLLARHIDDAQATKLGQVGDLFGGINALFAAFAFGGVAVAAYYQYKGWQIQEEQAAMARASAARLAFEPLFFRLLEMRKTPTELSWHDAATGVIALEPFDTAIGELRKAPFTDVKEIFGRLHDHNQAVLGPYFRTLYHLLKLTYRSGLTDEEQADYANIVRATLSTDELLLIAANCVHSNGFKLRSLVVWFGLLKHVKKRPALEFQIAEAIGQTSLYSFEKRKLYWSAPEHDVEKATLLRGLQSLNRPLISKFNL